MHAWHEKSQKHVCGIHSLYIYIYIKVYHHVAEDLLLLFLHDLLLRLCLAKFNFLSTSQPII